MKGNKKTLLVVALLLLVGVTSAYVAYSYAKYASEVTGQGETTVAKWDFVNDNDGLDVSVDITSTVNATSLINDRIAPGTNGSFDIELVNGGTETGVAYTIEFDVTNVPTNLMLCTDSSCTNEIDFRNGDTLTGTLAAKDATGTSATIYWKWPFGTSNAVTDTVNRADTTDGMAGNDMTIDVTITGVQTDPSVPVTTTAPAITTP